MKLLQELGNKNLSIEKRKIPLSNGIKISDEGAKLIMKKNELVKKIASKDMFEEVKKPNIQNSQSNRELAFGSSAPKKPAQAQSTTKKRRITNKNIIMSIGAFQMPQNNILPKATCNVYNLGGPPISGYTVSRGQVIQNRNNYVMDMPKTEKKKKIF